MRASVSTELVHIPLGPVQVEGMLTLPASPSGLVVFAHGSGSSRFSPRNNHVAQVLHVRGVGTLLIDLLTPAEDQDHRMRFDIPLLTTRLLGVTRWAQHHATTRALPVGYFGASTGAAAALLAAAELGPAIDAVVSRGGRPDLAGPDALARVRCPTLLLVGGLDDEVLALNEHAARALQAPHALSVVPGATHLFEEPGTLDEVARQAAGWFAQYLIKPATRS